MWRVRAFDRDGRELTQVELVDGELTIGRDHDRQLVLPSASVSRKHARIVVGTGGCHIIDDGSSNGVIVDGVRITQPTPVAAHSQIELAEFRLSVEPARTTGAVVKVRPPVAAPSSVRMVAEGGPYDGRVFSLPPGTLTLGRAIDNDLVFDDPSMSRKHARIHRHEDGRLELEDLGSSNGTFVNGRRVGSGTAQPGDVIRFGDLSFRVEGGEHGATRAGPVVIPPAERYALLGGAAATFVILVLAVAFLIRKVPPVQASGKEAIARIAQQAEQHLALGRQLYQERKYADAKLELDQAVELDPASAEARRLRLLANRGPEDDRALSAAGASMQVGDRKGLETALRLYGEMSDGSHAKQALQGKLTPALQRWGSDRCTQRLWADCAWALCRAFEVAPPDGKPSAAFARTLADADRKARKDRGYVPCTAGR